MHLSLFSEKNTIYEFFFISKNKKNLSEQN